MESVQWKINGEKNGTTSVESGKLLTQVLAGDDTNGLQQQNNDNKGLQFYSMTSIGSVESWK